jgi:hypothetical protein
MKRQLFRSAKVPKVQSILPVNDYQFHDNVSNMAFLFSLFLIIVEFLLVWINFSSLPPQIPLYFQRVWGEAQLAEKQMIWFQPGLLLVFFLVNYAISIFNASKEPLTARILGGTVLICSIMSIVSVWNIINLMVLPKLWW